MGGIVGSVLGAGASLIGASKQSSAAKDATRAQERAAAEATALQREQFQQIESNLSPYRQMGTQANPYLMAATLGGDPSYYMGGQQSPGGQTNALSQPTQQGQLGYDAWLQGQTPQSYDTTVDMVQNPVNPSEWAQQSHDGLEQYFPMVEQTTRTPVYGDNIEQQYQDYLGQGQPALTPDGQVAQGPTGMSPDIARSQGFVDQLGGLDSQFQVSDFGTGQLALENLPSTQVGDRFQTPQVNQVVIGDLGRNEVDVHHMHAEVRAVPTTDPAR